MGDLKIPKLIAKVHFDGNIASGLKKITNRDLKKQDLRREGGTKRETNSRWLANCLDDLRVVQDERHRGISLGSLEYFES